MSVVDSEYAHRCPSVGKAGTNHCAAPAAWFHRFVARLAAVSSGSLGTNPAGIGNNLRTRPSIQQYRILRLGRWSSLFAQSTNCLRQHDRRQNRWCGDELRAACAISLGYRARSLCWVVATSALPDGLPDSLGSEQSEALVETHQCGSGVNLRGLPHHRISHDRQHNVRARRRCSRGAETATRLFSTASEKLVRHRSRWNYQRHRDAGFRVNHRSTQHHNQIGIHQHTRGTGGTA